jgi:hypothetical protein
MFELAEAVASCLDRDSAHRVNMLQIENVIAKRLAELDEKRRRNPLTEDELTEIRMLPVAMEFVSLLQRKARTVVRKPAREFAFPENDGH